MVPESLRWLLKAKKSNGALKIVEHIAKKNGLPLPDNVQNMIDTIMLEMDQDLRRQKEYDIRDLFRRRRMAIYTLIFSFSW